MIMLAAAVMACGSTKKIKTLSEGTKWNLVWLADYDDSISDTERPHFTIGDGATTFHGRASCNLINGQLSLGKGVIGFSDGAMTKMLCRDMRLEDLYVETLLRVNIYKFSGDTLVLYEGSNAVMKFIEGE